MTVPKSWAHEIVRSESGCIGVFAVAVRLVLFDFDGTLVDTLTAIVSILNRLAARTGQPPVAPEEVDRLRGLSSREVASASGLSRLRRIFLLLVVRWQLSRQIDHVEPIATMGDTLAALKAKGYRLGIVTSNSKTNVRKVLRLAGWGSYFSFVVSSGRVFGKDRAIARLAQRSHLPVHAIAYVGDETRDIDAARSAGVWSVAVGWGFNKPEILQANRPDALAIVPSDLVTALDRLGSPPA